MCGRGFRVWEGMCEFLKRAIARRECFAIAFDQGRNKNLVILKCLVVKTLIYAWFYKFCRILSRVFFAEVLEKPNKISRNKNVINNDIL